jgi:hypothetical protein
MECLYDLPPAMSVISGFKMVVKYSVIQKDGLNFVSLYFKTRTSAIYDVNYI